MDAKKFRELKVMICQNKIHEVITELNGFINDMPEETQYSLSSQQLDGIPMKHIERYLRINKLNKII